MSQLFLLGFIVLLVYYWNHTQKLKQIAIRAGRHRCHEAGVQFLDHTVVQSKITMVRDKKGGWYFARLYEFDFTSTGETRYQGRIKIIKHRVVDVDLDAFAIN
ncbi:MAG: DUF3301 domain-containing protein [Gammaproteobacteria bacterium]|nr:DUF3301 domain-containing protein [Gammaproteobacteria bacterium]MDH5631183.1 DUF3301 domain-containing protein [Gammaproteobacteria bacterium]